MKDEWTSEEFAKDLWNTIRKENADGAGALDNVVVNTLLALNMIKARYTKGQPAYNFVDEVLEYIDEQLLQEAGMTNDGIFVS